MRRYQNCVQAFFHVTWASPRAAHRITLFYVEVCIVGMKVFFMMMEGMNESIDRNNNNTGKVLFLFWRQVLLHARTTMGYNHPHDRSSSLDNKW